MKIEETFNSFIKQIKLLHIFVFVIINLITFIISYAYFAKKNTNIYKDEINIFVPRYSSGDIGNFITILPISKLFYEYDNLRYNKTYSTICKLNTGDYDRHIFYTSQKKYISPFIKSIPIVFKIEHEDKNINNTCGSAYIKLAEDLFNTQYQILMNILKKKIEEENKKKQERDRAVKNFLSELEEKYGDQPQIQSYLTQVFLDDLRTSYENRIKTRLEAEFVDNSNLKIEHNIVKKEAQINNYLLIKAFLMVILCSFIMIIIFLFRSNKAT